MLYCFCFIILVLVLLFGVGVVQVVDVLVDVVLLVNGSSVLLFFDELCIFVEVFDWVKVVYVELVDDKILLENVIKGMFSNFDLYFVYFGLEDFVELQESISGEFGGLGIEVGSEDGFIKVVLLIDDIFVVCVGIQFGDLIVQIDGKLIKGQLMIEVVDSMCGKVGFLIILIIVCDGGRLFDVEFKCVIIKVKSVKSQVFEFGYVYLCIIQFQVNIGEEVVKVLNQLCKDNKGCFKGLVLDLCNNFGGVLQFVVEVVDVFFIKGLIVYIKGCIVNFELCFSVDLVDFSDKVLLVVLINGGSVLVVEIVVGVLQDQKCVILMGIDSFGKGLVQIVLLLNNDCVLKFIIVFYYIFNGCFIQVQGIVLDIEVGCVKVIQEWSSFEGFKEVDLQGYLVNGNGGVDCFIGKCVVLSECLQDFDYQFSQVFSLLKGLSVICGN